MSPAATTPAHPCHLLLHIMVGLEVHLEKRLPMDLRTKHPNMVSYPSTRKAWQTTPTRAAGLVGIAWALPSRQGQQVLFAQVRIQVIVTRPAKVAETIPNVGGQRATKTSQPLALESLASMASSPRSTTRWKASCVSTLPGSTPRGSATEA